MIFLALKLLLTICLILVVAPILLHLLPAILCILTPIAYVALVYWACLHKMYALVAVLGVLTFVIAHYADEYLGEDQ